VQQPECLKKAEKYLASAEHNLAGTKVGTPSWWRAATVLCELEGAAAEDGRPGTMARKAIRDKSSRADPVMSTNVHFIAAQPPGPLAAQFCPDDLVVSRMEACDMSSCVGTPTTTRTG
jgi:hypothetical protein